MAMTIECQPVPLRENADGVLLITGTRVPLDTVVRAHLRGDSPERIVAAYSTLKLADVYAVLAFYLRNQDQIDAYLRQREKLAAEVRRENEARFPSAGLRERLLARRAGKDGPNAASGHG